MTETRQRQAEAPHPSGDNRFGVIDKYLKRTRYAQDQLIETLHIAQDVFGCLDEDIMMYVARALRLPPSKVYGVATFMPLVVTLVDSHGERVCERIRG